MPKKLCTCYIKRCTGIICSNGFDELTFSHKSLQEYFTALYLSQQTIDDKRAFYKAVKNSVDETKYKTVLSFLSGLDTLSYTKYYYYPAFKELFPSSNLNLEFPKREDLIVGVSLVTKLMIISFKYTKRSEVDTSITSISLDVPGNQSSLFPLKIFHSAFRSHQSFDVLLKFLLTYLDSHPEFSDKRISLFTLLENIDELEKKTYFFDFADVFIEAGLHGHSDLIRKMKSKEKRSKVSRAFKNRK